MSENQPYDPIYFQMVAQGFCGEVQIAKKDIDMNGYVECIKKIGKSDDFTLERKRLQQLQDHFGNTFFNVTMWIIHADNANGNDYTPKVLDVIWQNLVESFDAATSSSRLEAFTNKDVYVNYIFMYAEKQVPHSGILGFFTPIKPD